jgi:putative addiction module component (TIGR02574 family)
MSEAAEKLLEAALQLSLDERLLIADVLYDSIPCPPGVLSTDDPNFEAILEQRRQDYESGISVGIPAEEVMRRLREKYG